MKTIIIKCINKSGLIPAYQTALASGADVFSANEQEIIIKPGERVLVPTGLYFEIPSGFEAQVRPRSGLAIKHGITLLNSPGTIDADYRGEVKIILINLGKEDFRINKGERIAQIVFAPVCRADFQINTNLDASQRGSGGFGSTGL